MNPQEKKVLVRDVLPHGQAAQENGRPKGVVAGISKRAAAFLTRSNVISPRAAAIVHEEPKSEERSSRPILARKRLEWFAFIPSFSSLFFGISKRTAVLAGVAVGVVLIAGFFVVRSFSSAVVTVIPHSETAQVNAVLSVGVGGDIAGETMSADDTASATGQAGGIQDLSVRAAGRVVIYNAYGVGSQALVRRTRLSTPDGKIFRLKDAITVPGATTKDGKLEPGVIEVDAIADEPGDAYNIALSDFTIPGFKGSDKYGKFYARSKTPMTGGFVGRATVVRPEDVAIARQTLERVFKAKLDSKLTSQMSSGSVIPNNASQYSINIKSVNPPVGSRADSFEIILSGTATATAVKRTAVEQKVGERYGKTPEGAVSPVIQNFSTLSLEAQKLDFSKHTMQLTVAGNANFVWNIPLNELKGKLTTADGSAARTAVFMSYPQIQGASVAYHPSWWRLFPASKDKIIIRQSGAGAL